MLQQNFNLGILSNKFNHDLEFVTDNHDYEQKFLVINMKFPRFKNEQ